MRHIDGKTTPGDVIMSGTEWILQGNAHVSPARMCGRVDMVKLHSYGRCMAWYNPMSLSLSISIGAFEFSHTTIKHVYKFIRWCMGCGVVQIYYNGLDKRLTKFCDDNRIALLVP